MTTDMQDLNEEDFKMRCPRDDDSLSPETERAIDTFIAGSADEWHYRLSIGCKTVGDILIDQISAGYAAPTTTAVFAADR